MAAKKAAAKEAAKVAADAAKEAIKVAKAAEKAATAGKPTDYEPVPYVRGKTKQDVLIPRT